MRKKKWNSSLACTLMMVMSISRSDRRMWQQKMSEKKMHETITV